MTKKELIDILERHHIKLVSVESRQKMKFTDGYNEIDVALTDDFGNVRWFSSVSYVDYILRTIQPV